jgi:hypothetical protein
MNERIPKTANFAINSTVFESSPLLGSSKSALLIVTHVTFYPSPSISPLCASILYDF